MIVTDRTLLALSCRRAALLVALLVLAHPSQSAALANQVTAFNSTSYSSCPGWANMTNSQSAASNFVGNLAAPGGSISWTVGIRSDDSRPVMGKWMASPWLTGDSYYDDYNTSQGFDYAPGISFYQGHGWGGAGAWRDGNGVSFQSCNTANPDTSCTSAPAGTFTPAVCLTYPKRSPCPANETCASGQAAGNPWCAYNFNHAIQTCAPSETNAQRRVDYSRTGTEMHLGESNNGGPWHPTIAPYYGNTQMAVILISHASHLGTFGHNLGGMFGGMDAIASVYTMGGDYADVPDRAPTFGQLIHDNPNSALYYLWYITTGMTGSGGGCPGWQHDGTAHGGFNGCGGHVFMVMDVNQSDADYKMANLTPAMIQDTNVHPGSSSSSNVFRSSYFSANWDWGSAPGLLSGWRF